jgi:hypothetical protein
MRAALSPILAAVLVLTSACAQLGFAPNEIDESVVREAPGRREPARVVVQHVLIAHGEAEVPGVTRTIPEAQELARLVLERARSGAKLDELVRLYSDDRNNNGIYSVANYGAPLEKSGEVARTSLVKAFGDLAFAMDVESIELVEYDAERSPYGFHVVQRLQ